MAPKKVVGVTAFARANICLVVAALVLLPTVASPEGKGAPDLAFEKLGPDEKVSGNMLCELNAVIVSQVISSFCKNQRTPVDDAIDREAVSLEGFLISNSSFHPTMRTFDDYRRRMADAFQRDSQNVCGRDWDKIKSGLKPEEIDADIKAWFATPQGKASPCLMEKPDDGNR